MSITSMFEGFETKYGKVELTKDPDEGLKDFAFSPNSVDMIVATKDYIQLWDYEAAQSRGSYGYRDRDQTPSRIAYSSDGTAFAIATEEGRVVLYTREFETSEAYWWNPDFLKSGWLPSKQAETYAKQRSPVFGVNRKDENATVPTQHFDLAFSMNGVYLAVAGLDGITVWLVKYSRVAWLQSVEEAFKSATTATDYACYALAFSPDNLHLAIGLEDGRDAIDILHLQEDTVMSKTLSDPKKAGPRRVTSLAYSPDGKLLAVARAKCNTLALLEIGTARQHELSRHKRDITCVTWSPNGNYIATGSLDNEIHVWEVATRTCLIATELGPLRHANVRRLSFSPDGRFLASCSSSDRCVFLWQAKNPFNFSEGVEFLPKSLPTFEEAKLEKQNLIDFSHQLPEDDHRHQSTPMARATSSQQLLPSSPGSTNDRSINSMESLMPTLVDYDHLWELLPQRATPPSDKDNPFRKHQLDIRDWTGYLRRGEVVGGGGFGDVYKGEIVNTPFDDQIRCMPVAVKVIRPFIFAKVKSEQVFQYVNREVQIWMSLRHPNVVPFVGISYDFSSVEAKLPALLSAWMPNGSLKAYAAQHSDAYRAPMLLDIGKGLEFLHEFNPQIVHGDIKAENILVNSDGRLALGDFGLSRMLSDDSLWITSATSAAGTVRWMAPELLDGTQHTVTKESDIYAFAITVVEVITGEVPFGGQYHFDGAVTVAVVTRDERPPRPPGMKEWLWKLVNDCWTREPAKRLTVTQVIERLNDVLF